jgi:hypothetical protein
MVQILETELIDSARDSVLGVRPRASIVWMSHYRFFTRFSRKVPHVPIPIAGVRGASLKMAREADQFAKKLLVVVPYAADAYLGLGTANYIIGSLSELKKFLLGFAGIHGDKKVGIQQLEIVADHGHYLRPFAKILLALAALREKKTEVARKQLTEFVAEFPENSLFASELAKLKVSPVAAKPQ